MRLNKFLIKYFFTPLIVLSASSELYADGLIDKIKLWDKTRTILKSNPQPIIHREAGIEHILDVEEYTIIFEKSNGVVRGLYMSIPYDEVGRVNVLFEDDCAFAKTLPKEKQYYIGQFLFYHNRFSGEWVFSERGLNDNLSIARKLYKIFNTTRHLSSGGDDKGIGEGSLRGYDIQQGKTSQRDDTAIKKQKGVESSSGQQENGLEHKVKDLTTDDIKGAEYVLPNGRRLKSATQINEDHEGKFGIQIYGIDYGEINSDNIRDAAIIIYDLKSWKTWLYAVINKEGSPYPIGPQEIETSGYFHMVSLDVEYHVIRVKFQDSNHIGEDIVRYYKLKGNQLVIDKN